VTILAWFFVAMTPFVLAGLFAVGLGICAQRGDEQPERDALEEKYALPACESRVHTRSGLR
jgi:hypothetical protein